MDHYRNSKTKIIMRIVFVVLMSYVTIGQVLGQSKKYEYMDTYPVLSNCDICDFGVFVNAEKKMTKEEAIEFVYNGDTSKLHCPDLSYDGTTEEVYGMSVGEYIPSKCFRIVYDNCCLVAYTSYKCDANGVLHKLLGNLALFDNNYIKKDSLCVYMGTEYDELIDGYYNSHTKKIFLNNRENLNSQKSLMYRINEKTLKFEEILRYEGDTKVTLNKQMDKLGWTEVFNKEDCE